ncbi:hypothetical protein HEK616_53520 [Streptomyces nigrescens]|uniref:Uncharacterized protein n=3 Tax=Streptomyces TaxID=1883 RepID=A0ABY6P691_9ACTN|nr:MULTISPECIES: hypothetical protein [Streptomyces]MEE4423440.1 hypothetical protein [Streptomyces sp. DSM 41528]UZJ29310.1 hypothetical protein OJ254_00855 [Streptomyces endophytica]BDM71865.1 hypothetical protein HEK616_53520 [Streptomyces nigrescens]
MASPTYQPRVNTSSDGWRNPPLSAGISGGDGRRLSHQPRPEEEQSGPTGPKPRPGYGLRGPRRSPHVLTAESLAALTLPVGDDGVIIGIDPQNQPAVLSLLRPTPLEVVLVGSMWMAQVLALRTVATGARVAVETARPPAWGQMAQSAGGGQQCVSVHDVRQIAPQGPSVSSPVLVVRDMGARPPRNQLAPSPWQSVLTVLPFLGPRSPQMLSRADLVGLQRLSPEEAEVVTRIMRLPEQVGAVLPTLSDNAMLWCRRDGGHQFVMTQPTEAETNLLGGPRRMD